MEAITSFSPMGYTYYGKAMLESMIEHWPGKIIVYYETLPELQHEKIEYRRYWDIPIWDNVTTGDRERMLRGIPVIDGIIPGKKYTYKYDVVKFSKKVFVMYDAYHKAEDYLFWLDADTKALKDVPEKFLKDLLKTSPIAYLGREGFHTEAGFIGFKKSYITKLFFNEWRSPYIDNSIYSLNHWHDCAAFDQALDRLNLRKGISKANNLSDFYKFDGKVENLDVFPKTVLSEYFIHNKGRKKYA